MEEQLKYNIIYKFFVNGDHSVEIYKKDYTGSETEVNGNAFLTYNNRQNILDPIISTTLTINLEATTERNFRDIVPVGKRDIKVIYKYKDEVRFIGYITHEGYFEDLVNPQWNIQFTAVDGLGWLDNIYMTKPNGVPYDDKFRLTEVITTGLSRISEDLLLYIDINLIYEGGDLFKQSVFHQTTVDSDSFLRETPYDIGKVLRSLLRVFGAVIQQHKGGWYIYRPVDLARNDRFQFWIYDGQGQPVTDVRKTELVDIQIGSEVDGFELFHINANQNLTMEMAKGIVAYHHGFLYLLGLLINNDFTWNQSGTLDGWTNIRNSPVKPPYTDKGAYVETTAGTLGYFDIRSDKTVTTDPSTISVKAHYTAGVRNFEPVLTQAMVKIELKFLIEFVEAGTNQVWYVGKNGLTKTEEMHVVKNEIFASEPGESYENSFTFTGDFVIDREGTYQFKNVIFKVQLDTALGPGPAASITWGTLRYIDILPKTSGISGQTWVIQKQEEPNAIPEDLTEVIYGDGPDYVAGSLFKEDESTPTDLWERKMGLVGEEIYLPILQWGIVEEMVLNQKNKLIYNGDIMGWIPFISRVTINNITGSTFIPYEIRYTLSTNQTELKLIEVHSEDLIGYKVTIYEETDSSTPPKIYT